jgi:hypothetical protein
MRRLAVITVSVLALAVPAAAWALTQSPGDGTLVVKNGAGPRGVPVVTLVITGAAIGHVSGLGTIFIEDLNPNDPASPEVTGASYRKDVSDTVTKWGGVDFRFRAVGGAYRITIYGSDVDMSAVGHGFVWLTGLSDPTAGDGVYSLNGANFRSLPATTLAKAPLGAASSG